MDSNVHRGAEEPDQQIEEMNADVRRYATRLFERTLPRNVVPRSTGGNVRKLDIVRAARSEQCLSECDEFVVNPKLQHVVDPTPRLVLELRQRIQVPRIDHQGFFTDHVGL